MANKQQAKQFEKLLREIISRANQDKPTAELLGKLDAMSFDIRFPGAYQALISASTVGDLYRALDAFPEFAKVVGQQMSQRVQELRSSTGQSRAIDESIAGSSTILEMASTAKLGVEQTAIGLGHDFIEALMATDFEKTATEGLRAPFPGPFIIRLPKGFYLKHQWQYSGELLPLEIITLAPIEMGNPEDDDLVKGITVSEAFGFLTTFRSGVAPSTRVAHNAPMDEAFSMIQNHAVLAALLPLTAPGQPETTIGGLNDRSWFPYRKTEFVQVDDEGNTIRQGPISDLKRLIYGVLLYLNTPNPQLLRASNRKLVTLTELVEAPNRPRKLKATTKPRMFETVIIAEDIDRRLTREAYKTWVRGHWRNQPFGPALAQRRIIWIKPHIRHKDAPGPARKDYEIEGLGNGFPAGYGMSCEQMKEELWRIKGERTHVEHSIESNQSDPSFVTELEAHLESLEDEYRALYAQYAKRCPT